MHVALSSSFWWTTARQIFKVPVALSEAFHLMSHPAGAGTGIYIDIMKLIKECAAELLPYKRIVVIAHWQNDTSFATIMSLWVMYIGAHALDLYFKFKKNGYWLDKS
jgi:hypothetical protein